MIKVKILGKATEFFLLAFFLALPFERIPTFEFKNFTIKVSYILAIFLIIFFLANNWKKLNKFRNDEFALVIFWILALISTIVSSLDIKRGIIILLVWGFCFLIYFIIPRIRLRNTEFKSIENSIIVISFLTALFGLYQFLGDSFGLSKDLSLLSPFYTKEILGFPRAQSVALEPLYFANFLLFPIFLLLNRYISSDKKLFGKSLLILLPLLIAFVLTVSRGAYVALAFSLFVLLVYLLIKKNFLKVVGILLVFLVSIAISFGMIRLLNGQRASKTVVGHSINYIENTKNDYSATDRIGTYKLALSQFYKKPILGNGVGSFGEITTPEGDKNKGIYKTVNNEYLEILTENGLLGFVAFVTFFLFFARMLYKSFLVSDSDEKIHILLMFLGVLAIFVQYNFFSTLYIIYIWAFLALLKTYSLSIVEKHQLS